MFKNNGHIMKNTPSINIQPDSGGNTPAFIFSEPTNNNTGPLHQVPFCHRKCFFEKRSIHFRNYRKGQVRSAGCLL